MFIFAGLFNYFVVNFILFIYSIFMFSFIISLISIIRFVVVYLSTRAPYSKLS